VPVGVGDCMNWVVFAVGLIVLVLTVANVVFTMVLPRRPHGIDRLSLYINRAVLLSIRWLSRFAPTYEAKDSVLAPAGPLALAAQLLAWAAGLTLGVGLMITGEHHSLEDGLLQAVAAVFTVGTDHTGGHPEIGLDIAGGAIWAVVVALQIAYLPTLYGSFSRRESLVALLESRAGLPAWGPEVLMRHQLVDIVDTLPDLYASWEEWAADVAETHTTYPVLLLFRSPEAWYSWVVGLIAVLDAAALHLSLSPSSASSQARLCLRMGFTLLDRIAVSLGWEVDPDPHPDGPLNLTFDEFSTAIEMLSSVGFPMERTAEESWPDFRGWRVNYETVAYRLADRLMAPPAPWAGPRRHLRMGPVAPRRPPQRKPGEGGGPPRPAHVVVSRRPTRPRRPRRSGGTAV
jgi:hypothetical protein